MKGRVMSQTRSSSRVLPRNPNQEYLRKEAKRLARDGGLKLTTAQRRLAQEYGYKNWSELMLHVRSLSTAFKAAQGPDAIGATVPEARPAPDRLLRRPVTDLLISTRALIGLESKNIRYIDELVGYAEPDLLAIKNFGRKSLNEIKIALGKFGLSLATRFEMEKNLPFLPLRELVAFPHVVYPVLVGRSGSINAIKSAEHRKIPIVMAAQKDPAVETPLGGADIYRIGVVGNLRKVVDLPDGTLKALVEGKRRVRVSRLATEGEFITAQTEELTEPATEGVDELLQSVASAFVSSRSKWLGANHPIQIPGIWGRMSVRVPGHPSTRRSVFLTTRANPSIVADRIASYLPIETPQKQELLEILNPAERLQKLLPYLSSQMFTVGDEVKVLGGAFVDFEGTIKEVHAAEGKVRVAISILGRSESIELDFSQIRPATPE
jgi:Lon protease-like protein